MKLRTLKFPDYSEILNATESAKKAYKVTKDETNNGYRVHFDNNFYVSTGIVFDGGALFIGHTDMKTPIAKLRYEGEITEAVYDEFKTYAQRAFEFWATIQFMEF